MKKILNLFMVVILVFGLTACSSSTAAKTGETLQVGRPADSK